MVADVILDLIINARNKTILQDETKIDFNDKNIRPTSNDNRFTSYSQKEPNQKLIQSHSMIEKLLFKKKQLGCVKLLQKDPKQY